MGSRGVSRRRFLALSAAGGLALVTDLPACSKAREASPFAKEVVRFGDAEMQAGDLRARVGASSRQPVVVLFHGGYWATGWNRLATDALAEDLSRRGYATLNLDYRRVGDPGGGWPGTLVDVAAGMDLLAGLADAKRLDLARVAVVGHSAGAQLAFWAAARSALPAGAPGVGPKVVPAAVVSLSGVLDLLTASSYTEPESTELAASTTAFIGGTPSQTPDRYEIASPMARLPLKVPQLLVHGGADTRVPPEQSRIYQSAAERIGDKVRMVELPGVDHFEVIEIQKVWWEEVTRWLPTQIGEPS